MWTLVFVLACGGPDTGVDSADTVDTEPTGTTGDDSGTEDTEPPEEDCDLEGDEDLDGLADCEDDDCAEVCVEDCDEEGDEDRDGLADCEDDDCADVCVEDCEEEGDEDRDGLADCEDDDCADVCVEDCDNGVDDDGDGKEDCRDIDCYWECPEDCSNGQDDDYDGLVDCEDGECADLETCQEVCDNDNDDDEDGLTDCDDDDCWGTGECATVTSKVTGGQAYAMGQSRYSYYFKPGGGYHFAFYLSFWMSASSVTGDLRIDYGSTSVGCTWAIDQMYGSKSLSGYYYYSFNIPVHWRSGWRTSGGCGGAVGSGVLPDSLLFSSSGLMLPDPPRAAWYQGRLATYDYFYNGDWGRTSGGGVFSYYTYGIELGWDPLSSGASYTQTGI